MTAKTDICTMYILICAATEAEIAPFTDYLAGIKDKLSAHRVEILISGVGMLSTTYHLCRHLGQNKPDYAIQAGIGGSFTPAYPPGSLLAIEEEFIGDLGVEETGLFKDVFDMGFAGADAFPFQQKGLRNPYIDRLWEHQLPRGKGLTVNEVSTSRQRIQQLNQLYTPVVESMEGAAFHYCCLQEQVPFLQLRAISNEVGVRDKRQWQIREAVQQLNTRLISLIESLTQ